MGPLYRAGKVKLLTYAGLKRSPGYEEISPWLRLADQPAWKSPSSHPRAKGTPEAVVERIRNAFGAVWWILQKISKNKPADAG
jgi:hypothetical protein